MKENPQDAGAGSPPQPVGQLSGAGLTNEELKEAGRVVMRPSIAPPPPTLDLDTSEVKEAFASLGMARLSGKVIGAHRVIGRALKEAGALSVGRSTMLLSGSKLDDAWGDLSQLANSPAADADPAFKLAVAQAKLELAKAQGKLGMDIAKSAEIDATDDAGRPPAFTPFPPRAPVAIANKVEVNLGKSP